MLPQILVVYTLAHIMPRNSSRLRQFIRSRDRWFNSNRSYQNLMRSEELKLRSFFHCQGREIWDIGHPRLRALDEFQFTPN